MKKINYHWVKQPVLENKTVTEWLQAHDLSPELAPLLINREVTTDERLTEFFEPSIESLHDPYLLYGMEKAIERINLAIMNGEKIVIYGDYDADGITSTTVMKEAIELLGAEVSIFLPNRFIDGYGPNVSTYERLINDGAQLIVTVDNGVTGHEAVAFAKTKGVDVIITDHHELPSELPECVALIHPKHPQGNYPFGELAGVGVAFKVASALLEDVPYELLDLVAIGTVADLVSLTGENRVLVKKGIEVMRQTQRIGLIELCQVAGISLATVTAENIGFGIGPRLNAIGRLGEATPGVTLLSTFDEAQAQEIAKMIQQTNEERQTIVAKISQEALEMVRELPDSAIYVLAKEGWHEGVLGIVASQIVRETNRPAIILGINPDTNEAKGSARSIEQVNLYELLSEHATLLEKFGGHHMAAGMTLSTAQLEQFSYALNQTLEAQEIDFSLGQPLPVVDYLTVEQMSVPFIEDLAHVGPFGTDNPAPVFLLDGGQALRTKAIGADQKHLKFNYQTTSGTMDVIAFGYGKNSDEINQASQLAIVGDLTINEWNNHKKPQLMLKDYQVSGQQIYDYREQLQRLPELVHLENTAFVLFDEKNRSHFKDVPNERLHFYQEPLDRSYKAVVFLDCPLEASWISEFLNQTTVEKVYLVLYSAEKCYLNGMPSRELFGKLFKMIQSNQSFDVRYKIGLLADYLKVEQTTIIFMIQVFFDLKFVTIDNGVMKRVADLTFTPLDNSEIYQQRLKKIESEKVLLYSNLVELENWIFQ